MLGGNQPRRTVETLKFLLQTKKAAYTRSNEIVAEAVSWMRTQFQNAEVPFYYSEGGASHGTYGYFQIKSLLKETAITLHLKIAEIHSTPYVFAEVRVRGQHETILFPFFGEIGSEDGRVVILHYIADFLLSTTPDPTAF